MPSYEHNKLIERISKLDELPVGSAAYATWIKAGGHLSLLSDNAKSDELIIYASGDCSYIHSVVVSEQCLAVLDQDDLLGWSGNPFSARAGYAWGSGSNDVWIEPGGFDFGTKTLKDAQQMVFARDFEGMKGKGNSYFEVQQEYAHLTGIHWRPEQHAYCRFDEHGDLEHVVSVTSKETQKDVILVSFKREPLDQYLAATNSVLVRMFDFTLCRPENFTSWPDGPENVINVSDVFFYRQKVDPGNAAYTRGVQIIRPSRPRAKIFSSMKKSWSGRQERQHAEFIVWDWRNKRITRISTDPAASTNYFQAHENTVPFEVSPAFFRPEVLLKYKGDRDKYTIDERHRTIRCRNAWVLRSYDVNEAGQVHVYIVDLRGLPYQEQLHWASFNENPKTGISKRALQNDFKGEWSSFVDPLQDILSIVERWAESDLMWWKLRDGAVIERVNTPRTTSSDEWAGAFMDLSKLVIEGFQVRVIRARLGETNIAFDKDEKSIALIEKLLRALRKIDDEQRLDGLRTVQLIRSKKSAHSGSSKASDLATNALKKYGAYSAHFEHVCRIVASELKLIEGAFSRMQIGADADE